MCVRVCLFVSVQVHFWCVVCCSVLIGGVINCSVLANHSCSLALGIEPVCLFTLLLFAYLFFISLGLCACVHTLTQIYKGDRYVFSLNEKKKWSLMMFSRAVLLLFLCSVCRYHYEKTFKNDNCDIYIPSLMFFQTQTYCILRKRNFKWIADVHLYSKLYNKNFVTWTIEIAVFVNCLTDKISSIIYIYRFQNSLTTIIK